MSPLLMCEMVIYTSFAAVFFQDMRGKLSDQAVIHKDTIAYQITMSVLFALHDKTYLTHIYGNSKTF